MPGKGQSNRLRKGRVSQKHQIYHLRCTTWRRQPLFANWRAGRCLTQALMAVENDAQTFCYTIMPDHLHWLVQLSSNDDLSKSVQKVKSLTTKALRAQGFVSDTPVWQSGFFDRAIRQEEDILAIARYIVANPLRAGLVDSVSEYCLWDAVWL